jgi:Mg/Co/Ni transporter MgtE
VLRYAAGKADWMAAGLPVEGAEAGAVRAGGLAHRDVPRCRPTDQVAEAQERADHGNWPACIVVDEAGVVLGAVSAEPLGADPRTPVAEIMDEAPDTVRPSASPEEVLEYLGSGPDSADHVVVTTSDGVLIGLAYRAEVEECVREGRAASAGAGGPCAPAGEEAA